MGFVLTYYVIKDQGVQVLSPGRHFLSDSFPGVGFVDNTAVFEYLVLKKR